MTPIHWQGESVSRVVLGAVQLGMDYGIANTRGRPGVGEASQIVEAAWRGGVRHIDTAQSYGESEAVLGTLLRKHGLADTARVSSKLDAGMNPRDLAAVEAAIERSFERLGVRQLWCMMLHRAAWLEDWDTGLGALLLRYRNAGRIRHLGVSLMSPGEAACCLDHPHMEMFQVACNAWDRRMCVLDLFARARALGKLCCVRSIYLQGLLVMTPEQVALRLPGAREASKRWHALCLEMGMEPSALAMRFALSLGVPLVVGAESAEQIEQTLALTHQAPLPEAALSRLGESMDAFLSEEILDPWRWRAK